MTVKELIEELKLYPDQDIQVFMYDYKSGYPYPVISVDRSMSDRCDINTDSDSV